MITTIDELAAPSLGARSKSRVWLSVMKRTALRGRVIIQFFLAANAGMLCAQSNFSMEGVTCRTNRTLVQRGGEWTLLSSEMAMPGGIKVFTNGTFQVNDGKARHLQEGQILRPDGNLLNPDGSIMPVFDHIAMSGANVMVFKDGKGQALTDTLILADGTSINPDGTYARPNGRRSRLVDGQLLTLEGVPTPVLDTISFRNGKVVVYKSGALIPLPSPNVILGTAERICNDGLTAVGSSRFSLLTAITCFDFWWTANHSLTRVQRASSATNASSKFHS